MARTIDEIVTEIGNLYISNAQVQSVYQLAPDARFTESFSKASLEYIIIYTVAFVLWLHEQLFELLKTDVTDYVAAMKPHSAQWYATKIKDYQHGSLLKPGEDYYDNTGKTAEQIALEKVIRYAAVTSVTTEYGRIYLRIKVAGGYETALAQLSNPELTGVTAYINRIKDAGVPVKVTSGAADAIKMDWTIWYNPLLLDADGNALDGTTNKIRDAIKAHISHLPFNGIYALQYHEDAIQAIPGVVLAKINMAKSRYGGYPFADIDTKIVPDAGYFKFYDEADLTISYIPQNAIQ